MEKGLYGALIVRSPDEPILDREQILVLDDLKLDRRRPTTVRAAGCTTPHPPPAPPIAAGWLRKSDAPDVRHN